MKETLLVKHAVGGRTFIDTGKRPMEYEVAKTGDGWKFDIHIQPDADVQELLRWKDELNVFLFQEAEGEPTKKIWFYVSGGPVEYDAPSRRLTIAAKSRIEYVPDRFGSGRSY